MAGKTYNTTGTIEATLKVYPTLYAVVAMRYHASVLACVHGIPFLMISYGPKTDELMNLLDNAGYVIRPEEFTLEKFVPLWEDLEHVYDSRKANSIERYNTIHAETIRKLRTL